MRLAAIVFVAVAAVFPVAAGCGGGTQEAASPTTPPAGSAAAEAAPAPTVWSNDLPLPQKSAYMKKYVVGPMGKVFQAHDAAKYGDFGCKTCHGPDFKDPHDHLPHLTFKDNKLTAFEEHADVAKFMASDVVPAMAAAMGQKPMDMQTHQGFGCGGCHTIDKK